MKRILLLLFIIFSGRLMAQTDSAAMMKSLMDYMTPGEMHSILAKFDGTWDTEITIWVAPDAPPDRSTGTLVNKMTMGGRYQESKYTATMMGIPFESIGINGYDNAKKVFVSSWIDNMGTGIITMEGTWDAVTKTISFKGKTINPMTMEENDIREIFRFIDDNTQLMEMYGPSLVDGKEYKMMEIKHTRKK